MKTWIALALLTSFFSIAGFGLATMGHPANLGGGLVSCLASLVRGSACSTDPSPLAMASFHLDAFKNFVTPIPSFALWLLTLSALALLASVLAIRFSFPIARLPSRAIRTDSESLTNAPLVLAQRLRWLSRLETRDPSHPF